ncbi:MAG: metallophosphoesterase [Candidatus Kariarchaeaceae archaeon]
MRNHTVLIILITSGIFLMLIFSPLTSNGKSVTCEISEIHNFTPYKFIALGDTRPAETDNSGLIDLIDIIDDVKKTNEIDFILHNGDMVGNGGDQIDWDTYYWPYMNSIEDQIPVYYAVGNHEYETAGAYDTSLETYLANVNNPGNEIYYSFNSPQNDTHFIVLNTEYVICDSEWAYDDNCTKRHEQQLWLEQDLAENSIDRIIVMTHRPFWGLNPADDRIKTIEQIRATWHDLFITEGVDAVFSGHAHLFYHTIRNGTHYTTTGGGTASNEFNPEIINHPKIQETWQEEDYVFGKQIHLCLVEVTKEGFDVDVIVSNGSVVYEYSIPAVLDIEETTSSTTISHSTSTTTTISASTPVELPFSIIALLITVKILYTLRKKKK